MVLEGVNLEERIPGFYDGPYLLDHCKPFAYLNGAPRVAVFIHGLTGNASDFRGFVDAYRNAGYDVVVPLLPGHGSHISFSERLGVRELLIPLEPLLNWAQSSYQRVHLVGLSFGAVLASHMARSILPASLSLLAPAFFLSHGSEQRMHWVKRFKVNLLRKRMRKSYLKSAGAGFDPHDLTYKHIPVQLAVELHTLCASVREDLPNLDIPMFHAHGDKDLTTPLLPNRAFLKKAVPDITYHYVPGGEHVLTKSDGADEMAARHIQWLDQNDEARI